MLHRLLHYSSLPTTAHSAASPDPAPILVTENARRAASNAFVARHSDPGTGATWRIYYFQILKSVSRVQAYPLLCRIDHPSLTGDPASA